MEKKERSVYTRQHEKKGIEMTLSVVILAAGQGKRMQSELPKVLHPFAGTPLLDRIIASAKQVTSAPVVVVCSESLKAHLADRDVTLAVQAKALGTADAAKTALAVIPADHQVLILTGDAPLIEPKTLNSLQEESDLNAIRLLTTHCDDPTGFGRIVRNAAGDIQAIVEEKEASEAERAITEINTGILAAPAHLLSAMIAEIDNQNSQGEFYLTDVIAKAIAANHPVQTVSVADPIEVQGVNSRLQLIELERAFQYRTACAFLNEGVTIVDPARVDFRGDISIGQDSRVDVNVIFEGKVSIGQGVQIEANCIIKNSEIADGVHIKANSVIEDAVIESGCEVGPFARLRPGTQLKSKAKIGNFVEVKKSVVGIGSKVSHLSYIGDSLIGRDVNIGAGTITCNYDGAFKHQTIIEDNVFVGSDTQIVAPVTIGAGATIGAGTTVTKDTPPDVLSISRVEQRNIPGWKRPKKNNGE